VNKPVIKWDGTNLPEGLKDVPPGPHTLEPVQEVVPLSEEEERGIRKALSQLDAGKGKSLAEVVADLRRGPSRR
jgi:hypothetical protein